jgi:hypothetical protein
VMLVTIEEAKRQCNIDGDADDVTLHEFIERSTDIIVDYLKIDPEIWDEENSEAVPVPPRVKQAVLLGVQALFDGDEVLSSNVRAILVRMRDPALA